MVQIQKSSFTLDYYFRTSSGLQIFQSIWSLKKRSILHCSKIYTYKINAFSATTQTYLGLKYLQHGRKAKYECSSLYYCKAILLTKWFF